ncbi:tRNA(Ile)-lysidine synthase [Gammaproteobacteria bacterium]
MQLDLQSYQNMPAARRWWVAYSGGVDSHCLLHALVKQTPPGLIAAVHIEHGIHPRSAQWVRHCAAVCSELKIPFHFFRVRISPGSGLEAIAREARYAVLAKVVSSGEIVFTAHHQDDQAETLLLQLLRGSGPRGLGAMRKIVPFYKGYLARPLLEISKKEILVYAQQTGLRWIEDESNADSRIPRNYLRNEVLPALESHWPSTTAVLARSAAHQAEASELLDILAIQDLETVVGTHPKTIQVDRLSRLTSSRVRNLLRYWIRDQGHLVPSTTVLQQVLEVLETRWDATPLVTWEGAEVRRYRNLLYLMRPLAPLPDPDWQTTWNPVEPLVLPWGTLTAQLTTGSGFLANQVTVRLRHGGERFDFGSHHRPLKDLWQAAGIPPWERARTPLLFVGETLVAVPGLGVCSSSRHHFTKLDSQYLVHSLSWKQNS